MCRPRSRSGKGKKSREEKKQKRKARREVRHKKMKDARGAELSFQRECREVASSGVARHAKVLTSCHA